MESSSETTQELAEAIRCSSSDQVDAVSPACQSDEGNVEEKFMQLDINLENGGSTNKEEGGSTTTTLMDNASSISPSDVRNDTEESSSTDVVEIKGNSVSGTNEDDSVSRSLQPSINVLSVGNMKKTLLVLDLNGLLADISKRAVYKRPFCDDFLRFCFERFEVGIWTSRTRKNVDRVIDFLLGDMKQKLLFCWDSSHCTKSNFRTLENKYKPLVFKELRKLWDKHDVDLPWEKGYYNESNTLLLDDSPYKALLNPPHTAIFPYSFNFTDGNDYSLGVGGDLRVYLEALTAAKDIQKFVQQNPFGQKHITKSSDSWSFYSQVIRSHVHSDVQANSVLPT